MTKKINILAQIAEKQACGGKKYLMNVDTMLKS